MLYGSSHVANWLNFEVAILHNVAKVDIYMMIDLSMFEPLIFWRGRIVNFESGFIFYVIKKSSGWMEFIWEL